MVSGSQASHIASSSTCMSSSSTSAWFSCSSRAVRRNTPSENFMMFALCPTVMRLRCSRRAKSNANRTMRRVPVTEIGFTVTPASGASS